MVSKKYCFITCCWAFCVILLGAYTRLKHAGLGCPDWPGCYGHLLAPLTTTPGVDVEKAWIEMIHRYAAGLLGLVVIGLAYQSWRSHQTRYLSSLLIGIIILQAALGAWTVTLQLWPIVVLGHLLGGITLLSLLWILTYKKIIPRHQTATSTLWGATLTLSILVWQIALGGWTSANYAALACTDFPYCQGQWVPKLDILTALSLANQNTDSLITIHFVHRCGALVAALCISLLCYQCWQIKARFIHQLVIVTMSLLLIQILLGITNVLGGLPLLIAVTHNGIAVLLLLAVLSLRMSLQAHDTL